MGLLEAMMWAFGGGKVAKRGVKEGFFEVFFLDYDAFCHVFFWKRQFVEIVFC